MSVFDTNPVIENYQDKYLTVTLEPESRDRAWNYIVMLAKKCCTLERVDDTSFRITPQKAYSLKFCFHVVVAAVIASEDLDLGFTWIYKSTRHNLSIKTTSFKLVATSHLPLSDTQLYFLTNLLIKKYASETIDELIKNYKAQMIDEEPFLDLIEELRQGYRKLKFHQHDFWYRALGGLQHDLGEINACLSEAIILLDAIKSFNSFMEVDAANYKKTLGKKWRAEEISTREIFEKDASTLRIDTHRKVLAKESAKFNEKLKLIRNRAIRFYPA